INVGNPEEPDRYWYFVNSVLGLAWIAHELGIPIVGGKVSFYNESPNGNVIKPVITVVALGQVSDVSKVVDGGLTGDGSIIIIGNTLTELGGSEYLYAVHGFVRGIPPRPRPKDEARNSRAVLKLIQDGLVSASMDIGVGGLLTTLSKMALINGVGFNIDLSKAPVDDYGIDPDVIAFSETNARYIIEVKNEHFNKVISTLANLGIPFSVIGSSGGDDAIVHWDHHELMALRLNELEMAYDSLWGAL
ncbi:MAG: AIR synthase-related protein, partial [Vulcanisaeta sp.]